MAINLSSIIFELKKDFYHPVSDEHVSALRSILFGNGDRNLEIDKKYEEIKKKSPKELLHIVNASMETTLVGLAYLRIAEIEKSTKPLELKKNETIGLIPYKNLNGRSQVRAYRIEDNGIVLLYPNDAGYLYDYARSGLRAVEAMKQAAIEGEHLGGHAHPSHFHGDNFVSLSKRDVARLEIGK